MRRFLFLSLLSILLFCFAVPRARGYTLVQKASASTGNSSNSVTFPNANAAGNLIIVSVGWLNGGTASVSDSAHNTYVSSVGPTTNGGSVQIWYSANIVPASANTVTVDFGGVWNNNNISVFEYSGLATSSPLDVALANTGNSNTLDTGPVTTTQANELIFAAGYGNSGGTLTAETNYTMEEYSNQGNAHFGLEDRSVTTTGTYNATFSDTAAWTWEAQIATFKPAALAGTPTCGISGDTATYAPSDTDWATPPVLSIPVAKGGHYTDAKFGCMVTRITDVSQEDWQPSCNTSGCYLPIAHGYSTVSPFNANDTYLMLGDGWGWHFVTDLQGNIVVLGADMPNWSPTNGMPNNSSGYLLWDATDPNVFYYTTGNSLMKGTISGSSVSVATVHQFTEYTAINFMADADVSQDGQHVAIVGGDNTGNSPENVFSYNFVTNAKGNVYTTACKGAADSPDNSCLHRLLLTPDNSVVINFDYEPPNGQSCTTAECGYRLWNGSTLTALQDHTNHLDTGSDLNGNSVFIAIGNPNVLSGDSNPCPSGSNGNGLDVELTSNPQSETCLLDNEPSYHVSYRGSSSQPWAALSFFDQSTPPWLSPEYFNNPYAPTNCNGTDGKTDNPCFVPPSQQWALYKDEIMAIKIDGSSFYRLARAYSRSVEDYNANPKASISRDGKYIAFDSNMAYVNGCPANFQNSTDCSDVYIVKVQ